MCPSASTPCGYTSGVMHGGAFFAQSRAGLPVRVSEGTHEACEGVMIKVRTEEEQAECGESGGRQRGIMSDGNKRGVG